MLTQIGNLVIRWSSSLEAMFKAEKSSHPVEHPSTPTRKHNRSSFLVVRTPADGTFVSCIKLSGLRRDGLVLLRADLRAQAMSASRPSIAVGKDEMELIALLLLTTMQAGATLPRIPERLSMDTPIPENDVAESDLIGSNCSEL